MTNLKNIFNLSGKTVLLTGATGNLGPHFARALASFGANVALLDLNKNLLANLSKDMSSEFSSKVKGYVCDISNSDVISKALNNIIADFGKIHVLINNAQASDEVAPFEKCTLQQWRKTSLVNEEGIFLITQAVGNILIEQGEGGSVINISSIYGILAPDHRIYEDANFNGLKMSSPAVYSYTKSGIIGLTRYLATYWAHHNIRVNALTPGGVESSQADNFKKRYNNRIPLNRMAKEQDLIGGLIFLASDASNYMTGQNIILDGGLSAW